MELDNLYVQITQKGEVEEIEYELPEQLDQRMYVRYLDKMNYLMREDVLGRLGIYKRSMGGKSEMNEKDLEDILRDANSQMESFREKALEPIQAIITNGESLKRVLQKAYIVFSSQKP